MSVDRLVVGKPLRARGTGPPAIGLQYAQETLSTRSGNFHASPAQPDAALTAGAIKGEHKRIRYVGCPDMLRPVKVLKVPKCQSAPECQSVKSARLRNPPVHVVVGKHRQREQRQALPECLLRILLFQE